MGVKAYRQLNNGQTHRWMDRQKDTRLNRQTDTKTDRLNVDRYVETRMPERIDRQTERHTKVEAEEITFRLTDERIDRQTDG